MLTTSVSQRMVSDVPIGAFLSAGIDSGALVGLMRDCGQKDIQTVTLAFEEFMGHPENEAPLAEKVAQRYETNHATRVVTESEFQQDIPRILEAMDQPSIDGINTWFVGKAARERGLKVAISGLGGDELFGGYPSFHDIPRSVKLLTIPSKIPLLGDIARLVLTPLLSKNGRSPKLAGLFKYGGNYPGAYLLRRGIFMPWELPDLMGREIATEGLRRLSPLEYIEGAMTPDPNDPYARVAALEASLYMRNQLLRDADWAGMAHSLEIRVPLVDSVLLKSLSPIVVKRERKSAKELIALSPAIPLDLQVRSRMKTGFTVPLQDWTANLGGILDSWRRVPVLSHEECHWARRLAYAFQNCNVN
jgi:asparagine synthase (glutamine-hydrolysing)